MADGFWRRACNRVHSFLGVPFSLFLSRSCAAVSLSPPALEAGGGFPFHQIAKEQFFLPPINTFERPAMGSSIIFPVYVNNV